MNAHASPSHDYDSTAEARRERLLDLQLEMLGRLAEVGLQIAEAVGRQVAAMADAPIPDLDQDDASAERRVARLNAAALAYGRSARAVRMTLALQAKLAKAPKGAAEDAERGPIKISWMEDPAQARRTQTLRVQRIVRRVAEGAAPDLEAAERLCAEAAERLQDHDLYGDLLTRPIGEVLANICRDLGLDPDWDRLAQEPWAQDEIRSGNPGSPFAAFMEPAAQARPQNAWPRSPEPDG